MRLPSIRIIAIVGGAPMYPSKNIVENAVNSKDHTTLVAAVKAAGLVDTLSSKGPFTVFAPTNAAFGKLPAGTVDTLVKPESKATLTKILTRQQGPVAEVAASGARALGGPLGLSRSAVTRLNDEVPCFLEAVSARPGSCSPSQGPGFILPGDRKSRPSRLPAAARGSGLAIGHGGGVDTSSRADRDRGRRNACPPWKARTPAD
jgi:hypothetical protein